jgi:hypothetical protein
MKKKKSDKVASTGSLPSSISTSKNNITIAATLETVQVYNENLDKLSELEKHNFTPSVADISPDGKTVYVGGKVQKKGTWTYFMYSLFPFFLGTKKRKII